MVLKSQLGCNNYCNLIAILNWGMSVYKIAVEIQFINALQPGESTSKTAVQLESEVHFKPQFNWSSLLDFNWVSNCT
jgi:hypothetical protein